MSLIEVESVTRTFGELKAVQEVSLSLQRGEVVGLLGANGAGKTTLIRMILGLLTPTSGRIEVMGRPVWEVDRHLIGYVSQNLGLYKDLTIDENLEFVAAAFGVRPPEVDRSLAGVPGQRVSEISLGLRRRTAFAAAKCHDPSILILDEPTSGVGPLGRAGLWEMIHESADSGAGVLVTTHHMEEAEECDRVVVLSAGREVAAGPVTDIVGSLTSVRISGADGSDIEQLRDAGMTLLLDGSGWRAVDADVSRIRELVGAQATLDTVPASFEEAFFTLSR